MDVLGLSSEVLLRQSRTFDDLSIETRRLSSGLRISGAQDDPSGLAVAEHQQAIVNGLQTGSEGIQQAQDVVQVADGALQSVSDILIRLRDLAVEAGSDVNSPTQLGAIQTEMNSLLQEINTIANRTTFNGRELLDGSLSTPNFGAGQPTVAMIPPSLNADGSTPYQDVATGGLLISQVTVPIMGTSASPIYFEIHVTAFSAAIGSVDVQTIAYSKDPNFGPEQVVDTWVPVGLGPLTNIPITDISGMQLEASFTLNNLSPQDVGAGMAFTTYTPPPPSPAMANGHPLEINLGGAEGDIIQVALPSVQLADLGIQDISILPPSIYDGSTTQPGTSNVYAVKDTLYRLDTALQQIEGARAQLGAQAVSLKEQAQNNSIEQVAEQASESNIRDANIGQDVTSYTRDQVLSQLQAQVLSALHVDALQVVSLVAQSFGVGGGGGGGGGSGARAA